MGFIVGDSQRKLFIYMEKFERVVGYCTRNFCRPTEISKQKYQHARPLKLV